MTAAILDTSVHFQIANPPRSVPPSVAHPSTRDRPLLARPVVLGGGSGGGAGSDAPGTRPLARCGLYKPAGFPSMRRGKM